MAASGGEPEREEGEREGDEEDVLHAGRREPDEVSIERGSGGPKECDERVGSVDQGDAQEHEADGEEARCVNRQAEDDGVEVREEGVVQGEDEGPKQTGGPGRDLMGEVAEGVEVREVSRHGLMDPGVVEGEAGAGLERAADDGERDCIDSDEGQDQPRPGGLPWGGDQVVGARWGSLRLHGIRGGARGRWMLAFSRQDT